VATIIFPSTNDVGGAGAGKTISEAHLAAYTSRVFDVPFVVLGLTGGTSANLVLTIAAGEALIGGYRCQETTGGGVTLPASSTRDIYRQLSRDGSNNVTGWNTVHQAAGSAAPADSVLLGTATTSASAVTGWVDKRPTVGSSLALQGTLASRPAPARAGRLYWATDTKVLYRDDGANWTPINPSAASSFVATSEATTSTGYAALATAQAVTATVGPSGLLVVGVACLVAPNGFSGLSGAMSHLLSGANVQATSDAAMASTEQGTTLFPLSAARVLVWSGLASGSTTVTAKFKASATGGIKFANRHLWALAL
jgi:hypothetical protein